MYSSFLSQDEPKKVEDALQDPYWVIAMQEKLNQFERNEVWKMVPIPKDRTIIGIKWVFRDMIDENEIISRLEAIRIFLAYVAHANFKVYQMDVKVLS